MVLIFLLVLAFLARAILLELERPAEAVAPGGHCPGCGRPAAGDWLLCPGCRTLLQESCGCGRHVAVYHRFCPGCGDRRQRGEP